MTTPRTQRSRPGTETLSLEGLTWVYVEGPSLAEMSHLRDQFGFHRLALEDCLSRVQLPKVDEYDGHVFIVTHFPVYNHQLRIAQPSQVVKGCGLNAAASYSGCIRCNARLQRAVEGDG